MDWVPVVFLIFKIVAFGTGMFFAIKWHYDQDRKTGKGEVLRAASKAAAIFIVALLGLMVVTFTLANMVHLDVSYP